MAALKKRTRVSMPAPPPPSFMGWFRETKPLVKFVLTFAAGLGVLATGVGAFEKLGLDKRIPATTGYVDNAIEANNIPIQQGIAELQLSAATDRLNSINLKIIDTEIAKSKSRDAREIGNLNIQLDNLKGEKDEVTKRIQLLRGRVK